MKKTIDEHQAKEVLENGIPEATATLKDEQKASKLISSIEKKLKNTKLNAVLEVIPTLVSCLKSYIKREYTEIPVGSMAAIVSALIYWINPFDIIPDSIIGIGQVDDAAVMLVCLAMVKSDLDDYKKWLEEKEKAAKLDDSSVDCN